MRAAHARRVIDERTGRISAKLGGRGASKGGLTVYFLYPRIVPPFFLKLQVLVEVFVHRGTAPIRKDILLKDGPITVFTSSKVRPIKFEFLKDCLRIGDGD